MRTRVTFAAIAAMISISQTTFAATQSETTPYENIRTRLVLKPGQTFLAFMKDSVKPGLDAYQETIVSDPATKARNYRQLQKSLINQGAGVAIRIDSDNYIFNIGYLDGSDPQNDVKSGRSYGVGPTHKQSDPSDLAYLRELEDYLKSESQSAGLFIEALMKVITNCDASGWDRLSTEGQIVATDFLAIYTAELDRHLMVDLKPKTHPWEIDLAAATFVSIFNTTTGLMMKDGALVQGSIQMWWAPGVTGSGIGQTRRDRIALQKRIAEVEAGSRETKELKLMIGGREDGDIIQGVLEYLNGANGPEQMPESKASRMVELMRDYLLNVQAHSHQVAKAG